MAIPNLNPILRDCKLANVYVLIDPRTNLPFYVGVTTRRLLCYRLSSHVNDAVHLKMRGDRYELIREICAAGLRPIIALLETVDKDWPEAEQFWIEYLRFLGAKLTNIAIGGPGRIGKDLGRNASEDERGCLGARHDAASRWGSKGARRR